MHKQPSLTLAKPAERAKDSNVELNTLPALSVGTNR